MSSQSLEKVDDKPEQDRDTPSHYYSSMTNPGNVYFYQSRDGRFIFSFEEGEQRQLTSVDEVVDVKLAPIADKSDVIARRVWREVFSAFRIVVIFIFVFLVELTRFIAHDVIHGFLLRLLSIVGDFVVKPALVVSFNSFLLPCLVFVWNVFTGLASTLEPLFGTLNGCTQQLVRVLNAFRLVDVTYNTARADVIDKPPV